MTGLESNLSCGPTASCRRSVTRRPSSSTSSSSGCGRASGRSPAGRRSWPAAGDFIEYSIGDDSIVVVRTEAGELAAFHNACRHRGTRLAEGAARSPTARSAARITRGRTRSTAGSSDVPDREEFAEPPADLGLAPSAGRLRGAGSCSSTWISTPSPCSSSSIRCRRCSRPTGSTSCGSAPTARRSSTRTGRPSSTRSTRATTCRGCTEQILPWTDDTSIAYEQFERHSHYGRLPGARRELRPSPRLGLTADEYDEGEILGALVAGLGGAFLGEERAAVAELRGVGTAAKARRCSARTRSGA